MGTSPPDAPAFTFIGGREECCDWLGFSDEEPIACCVTEADGVVDRESCLRFEDLCLKMKTERYNHY